MSAVDMATRVERLPGAVPTRLWSEKHRGLAAEGNLYYVWWCQATLLASLKVAHHEVSCIV